MAGQCADFGAANEGAYLCRMPDGGNYADLIRYRNGTSAAIDGNAHPANGSLVFLPPPGIPTVVPAHEVITPNLWRITEGRYAGTIVYPDGRVAVIATDVTGPENRPLPANQLAFVAPDGGTGRTTLELPADAIRQTRSNQPTPSANRMIFAVPYTVTNLGPNALQANQNMAGTEFAGCSALGGPGNDVQSIKLLPTTYNGSPITWGPEHLREIYRVIGQTEGQSGNAFICMDEHNVGQMAINSSPSRSTKLRTAIDALEKNHGTLDTLHYEALMASLRDAAGVPAPQSSFMEFLKYAGGLLGVGLVFGLVVPWISKWFGPPNPPGGGHGGGGTPVANNPQGTPATQTAAPVTNPPVSARVRAVNPLAAGIMAMNGGGQPGNVPGVVVPTVNGAPTGVGVLPAPVVVVPPVGVPAVPPVVVEVPVMVPAL